MFNIGFGELAVICIVLIIAVGPERLPSMMKTFGKTMRTLRQASRDIRASTGIDELMREDFDIQPAPRRPYIVPPRAADEPPAVSRGEDVSAAAIEPVVPAQPVAAPDTSVGAIAAHVPEPISGVAPAAPAGAPPNPTNPIKPQPPKHEG